MFTITIRGPLIQFWLRNSIALYKRRKMSGQTILETLTELRNSKPSASSCFKKEDHLTCENLSVFSPKSSNCVPSEPKNYKDNI